MPLRPAWALMINDLSYVNLLAFVNAPPNKTSGGSWDATTARVGKLRATFKFGFSRLAKSQGVHKWNECLCSKLRVPLNWSAPLKASAITSSLSPACTQAHVFTFQLHLRKFRKYYTDFLKKRLQWIAFNMLNFLFQFNLDLRPNH